MMPPTQPGGYAQPGYGQPQQAPGGMPGGLGMNLPQGMNDLGGGQAVAGIAKNMSWKLLFFIAACCTFASASISILYMIFTFEFRPFDFTTILFQLLFGFLMVVLDFPIPAPNQGLANVRANIYKFLLFLTRFTGRGVWYLFLGTLIFSTLYDLNISAFFGICMGGYVGILGLASLWFGLRLSSRLDTVRQNLAVQPQECPPGGFDLQTFKSLASQIAKQDFTDDELVYIFNGLSFNPQNDNIITPEEYKVWLSPGKMEIV